MKKGTKRDHDEMGEEKVKQIAKNEKDAVFSFFFQPPAQVTNKKAKSKKVDNNNGDEKEKQISLAVPLDVEVPKVQELLDSGAGLSYNSFTNEVKQVHQGVNAAKGRGVISNKRVKTKQIDSNEKIEDLTKKIDNTEKDDDVVDLEKDEGQDEESDKEDDEVELSQSVVSEQFLQEKHERELKSEYDIDAIKNPVIYKPNYTHDICSFNSVNTLMRSRSATEKQKNLPAFFIRRDYTPEAFELPKAKDKHKLQKVEKNNKKAPPVEVEDNEIDEEKESDADDNDNKWIVNNKIMAKIITIHDDGTFEWPKSSSLKCWNCCETFNNPPAMIPRFYNYKFGYYEVYGNFCSWSCAKRFASDTKQEFFSNISPSLDHFAWKYFGVMLPIPIAPSRFLLNTFSNFGMSLEDYRAVGKVRQKDGVIAENYVMIHPPVIPYELMVVWDERKPKRKAIKKGFDPVKKRRFEEQMSGSVPVPLMPKPMVKKTTIIKDHVRNNTTTKTVVSTKKSEKNLFTILSNTNDK